MHLRRRYRADNTDMVPTQTDRNKDRVDCSQADTTPTRHRYSLLDVKEKLLGGGGDIHFACQRLKKRSTRGQQQTTVAENKFPQSFPNPSETAAVLLSATQKETNNESSTAAA
ncbi:hypothetical protein CHARACLAT_014938 [Characodon lateralis]|uniref:Uncharacterized protein n=1 Tax=Characodon lateralis TaxID=208331 RepID=A0ABU7DH61_9TELE|nr:hypothetical protein [Characodon lateralis]